VLKLTSYERMRRYLSAVGGQALTDSYSQKQMITNWILAASKQIEKHLKRNLKYQSYTEYFDALTEKDVQFFVKAPPITTLTSVYNDIEGQYDGGESEIDDCIINKDSTGFIIPIKPPSKGYKAIRGIYTGGLAYYGVQSLFTCSITGTWNVGNFAYGETSEAVGIVKAVSATTLRIEILYGIFEDGETITEYTDENLTTAGDATAEITAITYQSLVEQYPDIVRAAEIQVRYYWKHKDDFELTSTSKDATNVRSSDRKGDVTEEAKSLLKPYILHNI